MMEDLTNHFTRTYSILSIIVVIDEQKAVLPNVMDWRFGRSINFWLHIISIPRSTNELQ